MGIPNIPTDNLYKFVAVTGVLIIFVPTFFLLKEAADIDSKIIKLQGATDILNAKIKVYNAIANIKMIQLKSIEVKTQLNILENKLSKKIVSEKKSETLSSAMKSITCSETDLATFCLLAKDLESLQIEKEKLHCTAKEISALSNNLLYSIVFLVFSLVIGFFMAIWGFCKWYVKVQKRQDETPMSPVIQNAQ